MANLWTDKVDTNGEYMDLEVLSGVTLEANKTYLLQASSTISICVATSKPSAGGFTIYSGPIVRFELETGEKIWVKTFNGLRTEMNLAQ